MNLMIKSVIKSFGVPALFGLVLVLPLMALEATNDSMTRENVRGLLFLFGLLWLLPTLFLFLLLPILRRNNRMSRTGVLLRVSSLVLLATVWGWGVADQMPCFLGIPNCD